MSSRQAHPRLVRKTSFRCTGKYNHLGSAVDTTFFVLQFEPPRSVEAEGVPKFDSGLAQQFGLPPLVGFLISGFVLHAFRQRGGETLETISNLGVTLMLFTIGLKPRLRGLLRPQVWAGTSLHSAGTVPTFVESHRHAARNVVLADATDSDFWERVQLKEEIPSRHSGPAQTQRQPARR